MLFIFPVYSLKSLVAQCARFKALSLLIADQEKFKMLEICRWMENQFHLSVHNYITCTLSTLVSFIKVLRLSQCAPSRIAVLYLMTLLISRNCLYNHILRHRWVLTLKMYILYFTFCFLTLLWLKQTPLTSMV